MGQKRENRYFFYYIFYICKFISTWIKDSGGVFFAYYDKYRIKDIVIEPQEEKIDIYTKYGAYFDEGEYLMYEAFYKIPLNSHSLSVIAVIEAAKQFAGLK